MMYIRRRFDGLVEEVHESLGAVLVGRGGAEIVPASDVRELQTIDRADVFGVLDRGKITRAVVDTLKRSRSSPSGGKRVITGAQWKRELGHKDLDIAADVEFVLCATRDMGMSPDSLDDDQRTIDLIAATDTPIRRHVHDFWDDTERVYDEALDMSPGAVRLERLNKGAAFLDSHNYWGGTSAMIGAIVPGSARVRAGALTARVKFSRSENGERAYQDAKDGILRSVSVGFLIHKLEIDDTADPPMHCIIDWEPHEVSAVAIPADRNAGFRDAQIALKR